MSESVDSQVLQQLKEENNNLIKDLNLTFKLLESYRSCLLLFTKNCKCLQNEENETKFKKLEEYFNKVNDRITFKPNESLKDGSNDCNDNQTKNKLELPSKTSILTKDGLNSNGDEITDNINEELNNGINDKTLEEEILNNDENSDKIVPKFCNQLKERQRKSSTKDCLIKRFVCEYNDCNKSFGDNYHLVRHIRGCHTLEKPYKCLKCEKKFAISEGLSQHVRLNHKDYHMFECSHENCGFKTIIEERLNTHLSKHQIIRRFECEICQKTYLTKYELKYHKQRIHKIFGSKVKKSSNSKGIIENISKSYNNLELNHKNHNNCSDSFLKTNSEDQNVGSEIVDQLKTMNEKTLQLVVVDGQITRPMLSGLELKKRLKPRRYRNKVGVNEDIICEEMGCGKQFLSEYNLRKHMRTVHSNMRPFVCEWPGCESAFKTREGMNCHLAAHRNERNFHCDVNDCDKRFNTRQELHQHKRSHGIKKIERYPCNWPACGVMCQSGQALIEHLNRHQNIKPFKCDYIECDKTYFTAYELRQHVMKVHDKSESFSCDYKDCAITFLNKRDLAKHRRLHDDVAKFVCLWPECSHTFNTCKDLSDHMNRHLNIKANKCNFVGCDRSYFKRSHLNRHIKHCHS